MGLSFLMSFFVVLPPMQDLVKGMVPSVPEVEGG
jgi:hypothetical protein